MTNQEQRFQHRWEFRRTETDLDSSSDDDQSRPNSASETKPMKQKLTQNHEESTQQTIDHPTSYVRGKKEKDFEDPNTKTDQPSKTYERKAQTKRSKKTTSNHELEGDAALFDLRGHMESLVEEIKTARGDLLAWMDSKMKTVSKDDIVSSKPSGTKKGQGQNTTRSKTPRKNPSSRRKKASKMTQNDKGESVGKRSCPSNEEVVVPSKETENVAIDVLPVEKTEKQKGKRQRVSTKKKKAVEVEEADQQSNTTVVAAADNCLTSPTVLPQKQVEKNERNSLEDGNEKDGGNRNGSNSGTSLSLHHQMKPDSRLQQKDVVFAQNGLPFGMVPQGSSVGIGMPNIHNQYGVQYLTHENRISRMYGEHGFLNGNHGFMGSYSGLNQHLKLNAQQGGVMALQCPDIRRGGFNQGNMTNQ